jgi:SAM-dependent methyltransferase
MLDGACPAGAGFPELCGQVERRYHACARFTRSYVRWKLRLDPVHRAVLRLAAREPFGRVVDLGCGRGQLGVALLEAGLAERLTGLDWDERLLAEAARAAGPGARFLRADLRTAPVPEGDTLLLVDVLYQLPAEAQLGVLRRAADSARRRLVLRLFDPGRGWRSAAGRLAERSISLARLYRPAAA